MTSLSVSQLQAYLDPGTETTLPEISLSFPQLSFTLCWHQFSGWSSHRTMKCPLRTLSLQSTRLVAPTGDCLFSVVLEQVPGKSSTCPVLGFFSPVSQWLWPGEGGWSQSHPNHVGEEMPPTHGNSDAITRRGNRHYQTKMTPIHMK